MKMLLVAGVVVFLALCTSAPPSPAPAAATPTATGPTRTHEGAGVAVSLTYLNPGAEGPRFSVAMETHSVDLDGYDLARLAVLEDSRGNRAVPVSWTKTGSGHHIGGTLIFPSSGDRGPLDLKGPVTVTVASVAGVDRTFRWEAGGA